MFVLVLLSACSASENKNAENDREHQSIQYNIKKYKVEFSEENPENLDPNDENSKNPGIEGMGILSSDSDETSPSTNAANVLDERPYPIRTVSKKRQRFRMAHGINSSTSDYHPAISPDGKTLYFTGMDRTGYFDNKIDFTRTKSSGGEDLFFSTNKIGIWSDAVPLSALNTNGHEAVTQCLDNGDLILSGNFQENLGPSENENGSNTCDLFLAIRKKGYRLEHFDEPINSIYGEFDGFMDPGRKFMLFASDRPRKEIAYHKKGWLWNGSYWGNTDIFISHKTGDSWSAPLPLPKKINSPFAERTPWLSFDGLTLYVSSNGYHVNRNDMDIYFFTRKNILDWDEWEGPFEITGMNTPSDDWGYQEDRSGNGYLAYGMALGYVPTKKGKDGTGFVFETNFRAGYEIHGQQSASFRKGEQIDIFTMNSNNVAMVLPSIVFDVNDDRLKPEVFGLKRNIADYIRINNPKKIKIVGHTDADGNEAHNLDLSLRRAISFRNFLKTMIPDIPTETSGVGSSQPKANNRSREGKQRNRRIEIFFEMD